MDNTIPQVLYAVAQIYSFVLLARIIASWIPNMDPNHPLVQVLHQLTEPVLAPIRQAIPPMGMIDLSPLILFIGLRILQSVLLGMTH